MQPGAGYSLRTVTGSNDGLMGRAPATERAERRAARREELLDAAIRCIRTEGAGVSMERIAAEAGVTKPILYRHFRHRAGLEDAIATRFTDEIGAQVREAMGRGGDARALLERAIDSYVRMVERDTDVYRFLVNRARLAVSGDGAIEHFMRRLGDDIGLVLGERLRELGLDSGPAEVWGHGIVGMVGASVDRWVERRVLPRERLVAFLSELLWKGLRGATRPACTERIAPSPCTGSGRRSFGSRRAPRCRWSRSTCRTTRRSRRS
jgi:AcrR family transcriptional regulator